MASLAEEFPKALKRAQITRDELIACRGLPSVMVEPQIAIITAEIDRAVAALAQGDIIAMLQSYEEIKGYEA